MSEKGDAVWWVRDAPPSLFWKGGLGGFSPDEMSALYSAVLEAVFNARLVLLQSPLKPTQEDETRVRRLWEAIEKLFDGWIKSSGWLERSGHEKLPQPVGLLAPLINSPEELREWEARRLKANSFELLEYVISEYEPASAQREKFAAVLVLHEAFEGSPAIAIQGGVELRMFHERRISEHLGYGSELVKALEDQIANAGQRARNELASVAGSSRGARYALLKKESIRLWIAVQHRYSSRNEAVEKKILRSVNECCEELNKRKGAKLRPVKKSTILRWIREYESGRKNAH